MEEQPELVDVRNGRGRLAEDLFRARVLRRERGYASHRLARCVAWRHESSDAEVEELHVACRRDDNVPRLDVTMNHQVGVGVLDRAANLDEQRKTAIDGQPLLVAVPVDRPPLHVLHHQVRAFVVGASAVQEPGDVGMGQRGENLAFLLETSQNLR